MDCNFRATGGMDRDVIFPSYYLHFKRIYGDSLFGRFTQNAIAKKEYDSKLLCVFDEAYAVTKNAVDGSMNGDGIQITCMTDINGEIVGYFRARMIDVDNSIVMCIAELVTLFDLPEYLRGTVLFNLIKALERHVEADIPEVDCIDFEVGVIDETMQSALVECDYHPLELDDSGKRTFVYEKPLKKQKIARD